MCMCVRMCVGYYSSVCMLCSTCVPSVLFIVWLKECGVGLVSMLWLWSTAYIASYAWEFTGSSVAQLWLRLSA